VEDKINPEHYTKHKIQPVEVAEDWELDFLLGNVVKYISRYKNKGGVEDLKKAWWYLNRSIAGQEGKSTGQDKYGFTAPCGEKILPQEECNQITIPNFNFTSSSQHKYNPIRYKGDLYEYTYTMGDDVYYTRVSGQSEGTGNAPADDNRSDREDVDGMGQL
jgi:hypothetical protein